MKILQINASARREGANSTRVANRVVERLVAANPGATVTLRDLATHPLPVLDEVALGALFTPAGQRSAEQTVLAARFDGGRQIGRRTILHRCRRRCFTGRYNGRTGGQGKQRNKRDSDGEKAANQLHKWTPDNQPIGAWKWIAYCRT